MGCGGLHYSGIIEMVRLYIYIYQYAVGMVCIAEISGQISIVSGQCSVVSYQRSGGSDHGLNTSGQISIVSGQWISGQLSKIRW